MLGAFRPSPILSGGSGGGESAFTPALTRAGYFDGASYGDIDTTASAPDLVLTGDFTIEAWIFLGSVSGDRVIASVWNEGVALSKCFRFIYDGSSTLKLFLWNGAAQIIYTTSALRVEDNGWQHCVVTFDAATDTARFYLGGALITEHTSAIASIQAGTANFRLGAEDGGADYWLGHLSGVRVWDVVRTQAEINSTMYSVIGAATAGLVAEYALNGDLTDSSGNGYDLTNVGVQLTAFVPWRA